MEDFVAYTSENGRIKHSVMEKKESKPQKIKKGHIHTFIILYELSFLLTCRCLSK